MPMRSQTLKLTLSNSLTTWKSRFWKKSFEEWKELIAKVNGRVWQAIIERLLRLWAREIPAKSHDKRVIIYDGFCFLTILQKSFLLIFISAIKYRINAKLRLKNPLLISKFVRIKKLALCQQINQPLTILLQTKLQL